MGGLTYKLEPGLTRITSPVRLVMKDEVREFESGLAATEAEFDKKWKVTEIRAAGDVVEVSVIETDVPYVKPIGEETFF